MLAERGHVLTAVARAQVGVVDVVAVDRGDDQRLGGAHELAPLAKDRCEGRDRFDMLHGRPSSSNRQDLRPGVVGYGLWLSRRRVRSSGAPRSVRSRERQPPSAPSRPTSLRDCWARAARRASSPPASENR